MNLPAKRQAPRSGIERAPRRVWPRHEAFVRRHACSVPGCQDGPIEFAHVRLGSPANGIGIKPPSWCGISLCSAHHREAHQHGEATFQRVHAIDMQALAAEFARRSPDMAMKEAMRDGN